MSGLIWVVIVAPIAFLIAIIIITLSSVSFGLNINIKNNKRKSKKASIIMMSINFVIIFLSELFLGSGLFAKHAWDKRMECSILILCSLIFITIATIITIVNTYTKKMYEPKEKQIEEILENDKQ